jgi:hypothetical protein
MSLRSAKDKIKVVESVSFALEDSYFSPETYTETILLASLAIIYQYRTGWYKFKGNMS